jgi:hypothetical protein
MEAPQMSFREKSAWVSFLTILAVSIPFFWNSYRQYTGDRPGREAVATAMWLLVGFVVLEIALHIVLALRAPHEARSPRDEREQLIDMRATRLAFHVLVLGAMAAVGMVHVTRSAWVIQQVVLFAIVIAELVKFGGQIVYFRRDA